jgi:hypothetical protein
MDDFSGNGLRKVVGMSNLYSRTTSWSNGDTPLGEELIAYLDSDPVTGNSYQVYVTTLDGEVTQLTFGSGMKMSVCWNPADPSQLLIGGGGGEAWLVDLELDGSGQIRIADYEGVTDLRAGTSLEGFYLGQASFSPDGSTLVFSSRAPGGSDDFNDIWTWELVTGTLTNVTEDEPDIDRRTVCIRADGKIVFTAVYRKKWKLFVIDPDGSGLGLWGGGSAGQNQWGVTARR